MKFDAKIKHTDLGLGLFGMSIREAHSKGICVRCKKTAHDNIFTKEGVAEYEFSAVCENCWEEIK
jgi:hypothetical protein